MCGIAGFVDPKLTDLQARELLGQMAAALRHRGPDGEGIWFEERMRIGLAHRRLSIIDLSAAGAQPMASRTGRFVSVYNGEIYNHKTLRAELLAAKRR